MRKTNLNSKLILKCVCTLVIFFNIQFNVSSQNVNLLRNGTLNGPVGQSRLPYDWYVCDSYSSPDIFSQSLPYPAGEGYLIIPVKDSTFLFLRTRGKYHTEAPGPYTYEYVIQHLTKPLEKDSTYDFDFFYCFSSHDYYHQFTDYPVRLELWAGNDSCAHEKLLMQTEPLQDTFWTERHCTFTLTDSSYKYVRVAVSWDSMTMNIHHESYDGMLLIDSLSMIKLPGVIDTIKTYDIYYKGDGKTNLKASPGTSYSWLPQENLSAFNIQSPLMLGYTPKYSVAEGSLTTCSYFEAFNIILNCDTLYPHKNLDSSEAYYNPHRKVILNASQGNRYDWNPKIYLSDTAICCPYLTGYDSVFIVKVWDKYNCPFNEKFKILLNCDTIVAEKNIVTLDTIVKNQPHILLVPAYGNVDSLWNPSTWLSCTSCQEPYADPVNSIIYKVILKDEFGCKHQENFKINVELFVPNVITPNDDGHNDSFEISGLPDNTTLKIYTKSGILIYSASPYNDSNCWKGIDNSGKPLESGTYWYVLDNSEKGLLLKGFIFLLR